MQIRKLNEHDSLYEVGTIYMESWQKAYKDIISDDYLHSLSPETWIEHTSDPDRTTLVLEENGRLIGVAAVSGSRDEGLPDWGELDSIYLLPSHFHQGYGKPLLHAAMEELKQQGYTDMFLNVLEDNKDARKFYESNGFTLFSEPYIDTIGGELLFFRQYQHSLR